ncbi:MAG TPA: SDR family NAD(P)-dependent oxidoreductase [Acidimicrobiales bacterium]
MRRFVLITGAGSGIGLASSLEAARLGFDVVAAVHHADQVEAVRAAASGAGVDVRPEVLDVTDEGRSAALVDEVRPWAVVNNAATPNAGAVEDVPVDTVRHQFDVMLLAPMRLVQLALPHMRRTGEGRIVNVSSIAHDTVSPMLGWYDAAKAAFSALSDALRVELAHQGVDVVLVEPGIVRTPIWDEVAADLRRRRDAAMTPEAYDAAIAAAERAAARGADVEEVAQTVGATLHAGHPRFRYRVGAGAHLLPAAAQLVPTSVRDRVVRGVAGL